MRTQRVASDRPTLRLVSALPDERPASEPGGETAFSFFMRSGDVLVQGQAELTRYPDGCYRLAVSRHGGPQRVRYGRAQDSVADLWLWIERQMLDGRCTG